MLLHLRSAVADYLPSGSPICSFGVTLAPKVLWGYKRQSAVCKSALRAFVPAISYRLGTISALLSARSSNIQRTYRRGACKPHNHVVLSSTYRKTTKTIAFISQYHHHTESSARCFYIPENPFFDHSSF